MNIFIVWYFFITITFFKITRDILISEPSMSAQNIAQQNIQAAEDTAKHMENICIARDEAGEYRRLLKSRDLEIEACQRMNKALQRQLQEIEEKQSAEIAAHLVSILYKSYTN